ncbi:MAG: 7TM diverse intracellular signaling domain-containing protein [Ketobacteraceae bacterium]|nr:7TM diverse intracellular signaling domain-containing protein [Ketobacteraceae bacterium]
MTPDTCLNTCLKLTWFVTLWIICTAAAYALEPLKLEREEFRFKLNKQVQYLEDPAGDMTMDEAYQAFRAGRFSTHQGSSLQFGYSQSVYWVAFEIQNRLSGAHRHLLEVRYPPLDYIDMSLIKDGEVLDRQRGGDQLPFHERYYETRFHLFPVALQEPGRYQVLMRFETESSYSLPLVFSSDITYIESSHFDQIMMGIYYGICVGLFAYNLFLYLTIRESLYLKYISYVFFHALFMASLDGLLYAFWPDNPLWESRFIYLSAWITGIFLIWFCSDFLHLKQHMPLAYKIGLAVQLAYAGSIIAAFFMPITIAARINAPLVLLSVVLMFIFTVWRYLQGYRQAGYFLIGMGSFLFGAASVATGSMNLFGQYDLSPVLMKLGSAIEMFCFSIALGDRINALKSRQASAEHEAELARTEARARELHAQEVEHMNRQLEVVMQARSDFLANMSHEIRTPMNGVLGMLELVRDTRLSKEQQNYIDVASRSGTTLLALINDILDLSKIEAGKLELEEIDFNLCQVIQDLQNLFNVQLDDKNLSFTSECDPDIPLWVRGDRTRVWQILTNLIGNAIKFTREGGILVRIFTENDHYCISVSDTGVGIPPAAQEKIFESFTQADNSTTRKFGGTGLGLTISRRLANLMGGDISVCSEPDKGTTFKVTLKLKEGAQPDAKQTVNDNGVVTDSCYGLEILLAEDNLVNQQVANGIFKKLGVSIDIVNDGVEAVQRCHEKAYDLIFMDVQMPNLDGLAATKAIKSSANPNQSTPIIAMTANAMQGDRELCLNAGMDDYMAKPIQKEKLRQMLLRWKKLKASA